MLRLNNVQQVFLQHAMKDTIKWKTAAQTVPILHKNTHPH